MATILITGSNRGIGLEFASQYLDRGDSVIATCRNPDQATRLRDLQTADSRLRVMELDVGSTASMDRFVAELGATAVDIFINNAGIYGPRASRFGEVTEQDWLAVFQVNTIAPLLLTQRLLENFRLGSDHKLAYITSKMGSIADNQSGGSYIYRSSKTALNQVVRSLSFDLASAGLIAAVIHPGWVQTDMGGPSALIDTRTSVGGMISVIDGLDKQASGQFFNYDGKLIPW
ncbi:MAG: SDR family oxidoreductase [Gammaproteobacteria bacterium]|nr:SDR family oxidoreductase [Pseudomonadales bacterium]MCP5348183.1 SDR family oxidoreductase [Pseudomonadales bacterium]